jgi:MoxR-like ATPase
MAKRKEKGKEKEAYEKLLRKRGLERHKEKIEHVRKKISYEEKEKELYEKLEKIGKLGLTKKEKDKLELLEEEIGKLEEEIRKDLSPEEIEELKSESFKRLAKFMRDRYKLLKARDEIYTDLRELEKEYEKATFPSEKEEYLDLITKYKEAIKEKIEKPLQQLKFQNPESYLADCLLTLQEYKEQLPSGIVETDYPKTMKEMIKEKLLKNRIAALLGETGTGKTQIAKKVAKELTGDYEFIPGHRFITADDLFYARGLKAEKIPPSKVPEIINKEIEKFRQEHPDLPKGEIKVQEEIIKDVVKGQAASPSLTTEVFYTGVLKAANEGKIVIIDEFNYIPPALLAGLNALIEAKPNEEISVFGQKVKVKPGFGVILTGNITTADFQGRYLQREKLDPALVNRLNSGLIQYSSLPQANIAFQESIIDYEEFKKGELPPKRELFQIGLAMLGDEKGNIYGPEDLLKQVWNLAESFSLLQKIYGGEKLDTPVKLPDGRDVVLKEYAVSNRTFLDVLKSWQEDNFKYPLDWYIYDSLIRPAALVSPTEAGQMLCILRERGDFFKDEQWKILSYNPGKNFRIEGVDDIEKNKRNFLKTLPQQKPIKFFTPQEVAEAFFGIKMPMEFSLEENEKKIRMSKEKYVEYKDSLETIENILRLTEETIQKYKKDEEKYIKE